MGLLLSQVPATTPYAQYIATANQTVFPYAFPITQDADLVVVVNGVTQSVDVGYSISGQGNTTGGFVTFTSGLAAGTIVTLSRDIVIQRVTQIAQNSGFSSTAFNAEFNNIYLILQQLNEALAFTLQIPSSNNPNPVTTLVPSAYANGALLFDANGNPTPGVLTSSGPVTFQILAPILGLVATAAEIAKSVTGSITDFTKDPGDLRRYGGLISALDNTAALAAAVAQASSTAADAAHVYVPPGNWNFASTTGAVCTIPNGVVIRGAGRDVTTLTVTGSANTTGFFVGTNGTNFSLRDLTLKGNSVASGFTDGGAFFMNVTSAATGVVGNYQFDRCRFTNFKATYWICQYATGTGVQTYGARGFFVRDCDFVSLTGNAQSTLITVPAYCIMSIGGTTAAATFQNIEVSGCTADCTYIKGFFLDFGGNKHVNIHDNVVVGAGTDAFFSDDSGCYAFASYTTNHVAITAISSASSAVVSAAGHGFANGDTVQLSQIYDAGFSGGNPGTLMVLLNDKSFTVSGVVAGVSFVINANTSSSSAYSSGGAATNLANCIATYDNNTVDGVRDCGFYFAADEHISCINNKVSGQTCNVEGTLLKGAIVANTCRDVLIANNKVWNCQQGIHVEPLIHVGTATIHANKIIDCLTGCDYIRILGCFPNNITSSMSDSVTITDNHCVGHVTSDLVHVAVRVDATNVYGVRRLKVSGNTLDVMGGAFLLNENGTSDAYIFDGEISGNKIVAEAGAAVWLQATTTPYWTVSNNSFVSGIYFVDTDHLFAAAGCRIAIIGNTFKGGAFSTAAWVRIITPGEGSAFRGNVFQGVTAAQMISTADSANLGRTAPAWTGKQGQIVETPLQIEQGSASSKYILNGYYYDATAAAWKQMRTLTGN